MGRGVGGLGSVWVDLVEGQFNLVVVGHGGSWWSVQWVGGTVGHLLPPSLHANCNVIKLCVYYVSLEPNKIGTIMLDFRTRFGPT